MAKRNRRPEKRARVILALIGVALLLWNLNTVCLYLLGDVTAAYDVTLSRSGTRGDTAVGTEYRFSASYKYVVDGKEYNGLDTGLRGPRLGPKHDDTVHFYPFAPRVSSLFAESAASPGMALTCAFALALLLIGVIPRKADKDNVFERVKRENGARPNAERITKAWLMENSEGYDDRLEEYYQDGWDKGDPSWQCPCGKWNTGSFCESCGSPRGGARQ